MPAAAKRSETEEPVVYDNIGYLIKSAEWEEILTPSGYTPLDRNEVVLRCAHTIADLVSDMTIMLMENGDMGDFRVRNELSKTVDIYPNPLMTRKTFVYKIVSDMIVYGNAAALPVYEGTYLRSLDPLRGAALQFDSEDRGGYRIRCGSSSWRHDELLHFVCVPDEARPYCGVGFGPLIIEATKNLLQANATKTGFLKSKWKPSIVISINADTEELQDPDKRRKILGSYAAETERGEPWLIPAGELDIKTIQPLTLQDLAIQDSITLDTRSIAAAIGIPPFLVGIDAYNRDAYNNFVSTTIMSFARIIEQELTRKILYKPEWYFKMNPKSLMQFSLSEKTAFVKDMLSIGLLNRNEGRAEFDYSPVDVEGMNDYAVLENYIKVGDIDKQKKLKGVDDE